MGTRMELGFMRNGMLRRSLTAERPNATGFSTRLGLLAIGMSGMPTLHGSLGLTSSTPLPEYWISTLRTRTSRNHLSFLIPLLRQPRVKDNARGTSRTLGGG